MTLFILKWVCCYINYVFSPFKQWVFLSFVLWKTPQQIEKVLIYTLNWHCNIDTEIMHILCDNLFYLNLKLSSQIWRMRRIRINKNHIHQPWGVCRELLQDRILLCAIIEKYSDSRLVSEVILILQVECEGGVVCDSLPGGEEPTSAIIIVHTKGLELVAIFFQHLHSSVSAALEIGLSTGGCNT